MSYFCLSTDDISETLLQSVFDGEGSEDGDDGRLVEYYIKVMRLFEQVPSPSYVIRVAKVATNVVNKDHPNAVCGILIDESTSERDGE